MKCLSIYRRPISFFFFSSCPYFDWGGEMSKQTLRHTLTPRGIIISDTRMATESNGAVGLPGSGQAPLSYIEMEAMGKLWTVVVFRKTLPQALLWDYENWPRVKIRREGWGGAVWLLVFFSPHLGWFCTVLGWVLLGWVRLRLPVPRTQGAFFLLPITTRCAQTCFKNLDLSLSLASQQSQHTHSPELVELSQRHTHTNMACNHRGPKGIPEHTSQYWATGLFRPFPQEEQSEDIQPDMKVRFTRCRPISTQTPGPIIAMPRPVIHRGDVALHLDVRQRVSSLESRRTKRHASPLRRSSACGCILIFECHSHVFPSNTAWRQISALQLRKKKC